MLKSIHEAEEEFTMVVANHQASMPMTRCFPGKKNMKEKKNNVPTTLYCLVILLSRCYFKSVQLNALIVHGGLHWLRSVEYSRPLVMNTDRTNFRPLILRRKSYILTAVFA